MLLTEVGNLLQLDITENKWKLRLAIVIPLAFLLVIILMLWGYRRWRKRGKQ